MTLPDERKSGYTSVDVNVKFNRGMMFNSARKRLKKATS